MEQMKGSICSKRSYLKRDLLILRLKVALVFSIQLLLVILVPRIRRLFSLQMTLRFLVKVNADDLKNYGTFVSRLNWSNLQ